MQKQSSEQKNIISTTMHEFKHGELKSGSGKKVKNPRQAIAIGLKEAGASKYESGSENKRNLNRTRLKIRTGKKK